MKCTACTTEVKPVVAIDIDGTLADYHGAFVSFLRSYFGRPFNGRWDGTGNWEDHLGLTRSQYREAKLAFRQGGYKRSLPTFSGANDLTMALVMAGAELWMTTTRPWMRLDSVDPDTREWLSRNMIPYDHLLYDEHKYPKLLELIGAGRLVGVVDDLRAQCYEAAEVFGKDAVWQIVREHNRAAEAQWPQEVVSLPHAQQVLIEAILQWEKSNGG